MNETKYEIKKTSHFKKDYQLAKKRGADIQLLREIILKLSDGQTPPAKNRDHALTGDWLGFRECHISGDWLLIYKKDDDILVLTLMRTGSHSDLSF
ncbi:MAG: type II toxin-antitoxin system YafQ family toxin [Firmicutes bacterium]|nr:type II toxin-antitoxin system YafQ family toxin [Bacillota bacterium]